MPIDPVRINELASSDRAFDIVKLRATGKTYYEISWELGIPIEEVRRINKVRSFRKYLKIYRDQLIDAEIKGEEPVNDEDIRGTFDNYSPEAVRKLVSVMRTANSPKEQKDAACEILDRAGYVKVQKQLTISADAESIIRELNKQASLGPPAKEIDITPENEEEK